MQSQSVSEIAHDVVPVCPETNDDTGTTVGEDPDGHVGLLLDGAGVPDEVDGTEGSDGVGDIVCAVSEGSGSRGEDLEEGVEMLGFVVKVGGAGVEVLDVSGEFAIAGLLGDDVLADTVHEGVDGELEQVAGRVPGSSVCGFELGEGLGLAGGGDCRGVLLNVAGVAGGEFGVGVCSCFLLALEVLHVGDGGGLDVCGFEVSAGRVPAVVVGDNADLGALWRIWDGTALVQERAKEEVVPAEGPVLLDEQAVEVWDEEEQAERDDGECDTEDTPEDLSGAPVVELEVWRALPDDNHGEDTRG